MRGISGQRCPVGRRGWKGMACGVARRTGVRVRLMLRCVKRTAAVGRRAESATGVLGVMAALTAR